MVSEFLWLSGHEFESHHPYLFDKKNQTQGNVSMCKFQAQIIWRGVLENNINYILEPYLKT